MAAKYIFSSQGIEIFETDQKVFTLFYYIV